MPVILNRDGSACVGVARKLPARGQREGPAGPVHRIRYHTFAPISVNMAVLIYKTFTF